MGEQILTLAVLSILITAPLGAISILALGPKLLTSDKLDVGLPEHAEDHDHDEEEEEQHH